MNKYYCKIISYITVHTNFVLNLVGNFKSIIIIHFRVQKSKHSLLKKANGTSTMPCSLKFDILTSIKE